MNALSMDTSAEDIRREMQLTRQRVRAEVTEVVAGARQFADWRFYPRQFPWATVGAAAALAFAAIPKRANVVRPDSETLEKLVRSHKLLLEAKSAEAPAKKGVAAAMVATLGSALLRYGLQYASRQIGQRLNTAFLDRTHQESME